ncbi:hypothetical protein ACFSTC_58515 [Nonomuraea ferruginea]
MSPEQVSGSQVGSASDIFSWGSTVAFAAAGASPFGSGSVPTVLLRIVNDPPGPARALRPVARRGRGRPAQDARGSSHRPGDPGPPQHVHPVTRRSPPDDTGGSAERAGPTRPPRSSSPGPAPAQAARVVDGRRKWVAGAAAVVVATAGVAAAFASQGQGVRDPTAKGTVDTPSPAASRTTAARNPPAGREGRPLLRPARAGGRPPGEALGRGPAEGRRAHDETGRHPVRHPPRQARGSAPR